jgi:hypothetical protein
MKRKFYFIIMVVMCISIATPVFARGPFGDTDVPIDNPYPNDEGGCDQLVESSSHFFWIPYNVERHVVKNVSCVQSVNN